MKKYQTYRKVGQLLFLALAMVGFFINIRFVILLLLPASLFVGNFFCGWVCPYGTMQEWFGMLGKALFKKKVKMPSGVQTYLQYTRYVLFALSLLGVASFVFETINGYGTFMSIWMNGFVMTTAFAVMASFLLIALIFDRPYCNYFCSEGIKYGVFSMTRICSIKRRVYTCVQCKKCDKACPMNIDVSRNEQVSNAQCINCFQCIDACPVEGTLSYGRVKLPLGIKKKWLGGTI